MSERLRKRLLTATVLAGVAVLAAIGWAERDRFGPVEVGSRAPDFTARSLDGEPVSLESFRGRVVLLNIWATWCAPCVWEMPALERLYRELGSDDFVVVAVNVDAAGAAGIGSSSAKVRAFVRERGLTFPVLLDPEGTVQQLYQVVGLPTSLLIDRDGRIRRRILGPAHWDDPPYSARIRRLLER